MKTLGQVIALSCDYLKGKQQQIPKREVEEMIASSLGMKRLDLYLNFDKPLVEEELALIRKNLSRLATGEPIQYIEGWVDFYGCKIAVDRRVLIPRPETEMLVDYISKWLARTEHAGKILADICTGSGCIGIALKKANRQLSVLLSDLSPEALEVATLNAKTNQVETTSRMGDLLAPLGAGEIDYLVCNPPYVTEAEFQHLEPNVRDFEPKGALVSGPSGLECYERLAHDLPRVMKPGGWVWLEIGKGQAPHLQNIFSKFTNLKVIKDLSGIDRFIELQIPVMSAV